MLENIEHIASYVAGINQVEFRGDGRTRDAVERCLERICEAAVRLGDQVAQLMPNQPWGEIRGMGNRLRHGYDRVSFTVIWHAVQDALRSLQTDLRYAPARLRVGGTGT